MFFFVLASLARSSISIGLLDRPLIASFILGLVTDTLAISLPLGAMLELFWLDALRLGAIIPPSGTLSFLLLFPFILLFNWEVPTQLAVPIIICLPLAYSIKWLELLQRKHANSYIAQIETWIDNPKTGLSPQKIIYKALCQSIVFAALLYLVLFALLYKLFSILNKLTYIPSIDYINWPTLYSMSLMGAILALRTKRAYAILALALLVIFLCNM